MRRFSDKGAAIKLDCFSLKSELALLPPGVVLVAVNSGVSHVLAQSAYKTRVEECAAAAAAMGVKTLREASLGKLNLIADERLRRRARHVLTENLRVLSFVAAAKRGQIAELGHLMLDSHRSLRDDYEVSCPEIDFLVDAAIAIDGVWGSRITGGGFGGCTINLLDPTAVEKFQQTLFRRYREKFGVEPCFYPVTPASGACQIS